MAESITRPRKPAKKPKPVKPPRENVHVGVPVSRKVVAALAVATGAPQTAVVQAIAKRITPELLREVHKELTEQTRLMADTLLEETLRTAFFDREDLDLRFPVIPRTPTVGPAPTEDTGRTEMGEAPSS